VAWSTHDYPGVLLENQAYFGEATDRMGYVASGCTHGTSATTSVSIAACAAYARVEEAAGARLVYLQETQVRTLTYSGGDGTYWLGARATPGETPAGWTCQPGTHYCWKRSTTRPPYPGGVVLLQQTTVSGGAITAVDPVLPQPGGVYLPERYGAQGDGTTDDTAAFKALEAALPRAGGVVQLAKGATYHFNTAGGLVMEKTVQLRGAGQDATQLTCGTAIGNAACVTLKGHYSSVSDLSLTGEHTNFTNAELYTSELRSGIQVEGDHTWVDRVAVTNAIVGIRFTGPPADGPVGGGVRASRLLNTIVNYAYPGTACNNNAGIALFGAKMTTVRDNYITGFGEGIDASANGAYIHVTGNTTEDTCDAGIYFATTDHTLFQGNTVQRFKGSGLKMRGVFNSIVGNLVTSGSTATPGSVGISMSGYTAPVAGINTSRLLIANNTVLCDCGTAIYMGNDSSIPDGSVRGGMITSNIIRFLGPGTNEAITNASGIVLQSLAQQVSITNNIIQDAPHVGIRTSGVGAGTMHNIVISGNIIENVGTAGAANKGMHLGDIQGCVVSNNVIQNVLDNDPGIHLLTVNDCDIVNNQVGSTTTPPTTGSIVTESSGQVGLSNTYRNNRTTGVTILTYNIASGSGARVESNETFIPVALTSDYTIQPGQAQRWVFIPQGGTRTINVSPIWPVTDTLICNRSSTENLVFAPLSETILPNKCAWYQSQNPNTFWRIDPSP
jgi:hypothetical protein